MNVKTVCILLATLLLAGCAHNKYRTAPTGCGELVLGTPCFANAAGGDLSSRWPLWTGIGLESVALVAAGVGTGHFMLADKRRSDADSATGVGERGLLLDKAERSDEIAAWSLGGAVPLAVAGAVFIIVDVVGRGNSKDADDIAESDGLSISPSLAVPAHGDGAVMGATLTW